MRALRRRRRAASLAVAVVAGSTATAPGSEGLACGYEDPQSVSRASLSWGYPDSLHVIGAISSEVAARRLPLANFDRGEVDLFGRKFNVAKTSLEQFGGMLSASPEPLRTPVAVVLIEPMLWARFEPTADGLRTIVHVSGANRDDLVMVTGEAVIAEMTARRLTFGQAHARGVVRLYGQEAQIDAFAETYHRVGANFSTLEPAMLDGAAAHLNFPGGTTSQRPGTTEQPFGWRKSCE
jgi:hypothetical protein